MLKKCICVLFGSLGVVGMVYGVALGESYANGQEGLKGATLPPPGFYYRMYNAYVASDDLLDPNGDEIPLDFEIKWFVNAHRFIWIYGHIDFLGADIGADFVVPIWHGMANMTPGPILARTCIPPCLPWAAPIILTRPKHGRFHCSAVMKSTVENVMALQ